MNLSKFVVEGKEKRNRGTREKKKEGHGFSDVQKHSFFKVAVEWFEGITSAKLNLAFVSKGFAGRCEFLETIKRIMDSKLKGVAEWSDIVAKDGYNGWITNMAKNFTGQTDQWINVVYPLVGGSMDPYDRLRWQAKNWVGNAKSIIQRAKRHDVNMTKIDQYLVLGNSKFVLQFGREVKVEVVNTKVLGQRLYGTIHLCRILGQEPYIDLDVDYVVKRFQTAGLAECEAFMLQEIKLVPFTNHPDIIKPFAAQLKPIPSLFLPFWNENTWFGHLETLKLRALMVLKMWVGKWQVCASIQMLQMPPSLGNSLCWGLFLIFVKIV